MKKTVLVRGPALSQSGYGEHTRFVLRALRMREDEFDIHILPTGWGETGWLALDDEERVWIDGQVNKATEHLQAKLPYDITVQVTIPNEWQKMAPINIGVTAGIECNKVSPVWLEKANEMDKVITISEHSKTGFGVVYQGQNSQTGQPMVLRCDVPVEVVGYPVKTFDELPDLGIDLEYDFNFLTIAQWGPRKNLHNLIRWFVEENIDQEVGLVVKTSLKNNSAVDREYAEKMVESSIPDLPDRKCKVYFLHGDMAESEVHSLYKHPKIKALVSLTHGEGFGLPLFEAAYSGLPIIAPGWSGQTDFLYAPFNSTAKKKKKKKKALFADVDYTIGPIPQEAVWPGVLEKETMWCFPTEGSFKLRMRQVRKNYDKWLKKAEQLQEWVSEEFEADKIYDKLSATIAPALTAEEINLRNEIEEMFKELNE
jgi:glycosyltransferase involved in cell wall biosynthesis